jgi:predicted kinase
VGAEEQRKAAEIAIQYFNLSLKYALLGSNPMVLLFMGAVGTGKSTLARSLSKKLGIEHFSSDYIRKTMAGLDPEKRTPASERDALYSNEMSDKNYNRLFEKAVGQFAKGKSVILDATFSRREKRGMFIKKMKQREMPFLFIETRAPEAIVKSRLQGREGGAKIVSDARLEDFEKLKEHYDTPDELNEEWLVPVSTDQPLEKTLAQLYEALVKRNIGG